MTHTDLDVSSFVNEIDYFQGYWIVQDKSEETMQKVCQNIGLIKSDAEQQKTV